MHEAPYPHEGGCQGCADARVCNVCGSKLTAATKCTNGRCGTCHGKHCTLGGSTSPGHGFGTVGFRPRDFAMLRNSHGQPIPLGKK